MRLRNIVQKLALFVATLWAALTFNFILPRLMPGSPADSVIERMTQSGVAVTAAMRRAIGIQLGLPHTSLLVQYGDYLANVARLRLGISSSIPGESVMRALEVAAPWSLALVGSTTITTFFLGTLLGVYAAWHRQSRIDQLVTIGTTLTSSFPPFWIALMLLFFFGFKLRWFPLVGGYYPGETPHLTWNFMVDASYHLALGWIALVITGLSGWVFGMRNNMVTTFGQDYVTFAEANGLRGRKVALSYAARNALLPNVTNFALALGGAIGGTVLIEDVFGIPGIGNLLLQAINARDYSLMQGILLFTSVSMLVAIFAVDLLYTWLDPRTRAR